MFRTDIEIREREVDKMENSAIIDQTRPDQTRPDQTRPDHLIVRNSSLELLRIIAMLMIIASHLAQHGGFDFPLSSITINRLWWQFMRISGARGNDLFVLISGYFLINSSGIKFHKIFNLWARMLLYSVVVLFALILPGIEMFSVKAMLEAVTPVIHAQWWFPRTYFMLYLIHPYLNIFLRSFDRKGYEKFLIVVMTFLWCIIPIFLPSGFRGRGLVEFISLYSLAGYFRLWANDFGGKRFILYSVLCIMVHVFVHGVLDAIGIERETFFGGMMNPFILLSALCMFLGFRKLDIYYSKIINLIAASTFGVYMLHENRFCWKILWNGVFRTASFQNSPYLIPYSITVILVVYLVCTIIELARSRIFRVISRGKLS